MKCYYNLDKLFSSQTRGNTMYQEIRNVVTIEEWTDRIYQCTPQELMITNVVSGRKMRIFKYNLPDTGKATLSSNSFGWFLEIGPISFFSFTPSMLDLFRRSLCSLDLTCINLQLHSVQLKVSCLLSIICHVLSALNSYRFIALVESRRKNI